MEGERAGHVSWTQGLAAALGEVSVKNASHPNPCNFPSSAFWRFTAGSGGGWETERSRQSPSPRKRGSEGRVETRGDPGRCRQEDKRPGAHGWGRRWPFLKPDFMRPGADWRRSAEPQHGRSDALCRDARSEDRSLLGDVAVAAADDLCGYCRRIFRLGCFVLHGSNQFRGAMKRAPCARPAEATMSERYPVATPFRPQITAPERHK